MTETDKAESRLEKHLGTQCKCEIHLVAQDCHCKRAASDEERTKPGETKKINACAYSCSLGDILAYV